MFLRFLFYLRDSTYFIYKGTSLFRRIGISKVSVLFYRWTH